MAVRVWLAAPLLQADPLDTYTPMVSRWCSMVSLRITFRLKFSTSGTASSGLFRVTSGNCFSPSRRRVFSSTSVLWRWGSVRLSSVAAFAIPMA